MSGGGNFYVNTSFLVRPNLPFRRFLGKSSRWCICAHISCFRNGAYPIPLSFPPNLTDVLIIPLPTIMPKRRGLCRSFKGKRTGGKTPYSGKSSHKTTPQPPTTATDPLTKRNANCKVDNECLSESVSPPASQSSSVGAVDVGKS